MKQVQRKSISVPGLANGLQVLRVLEDGREKTLQEISKKLSLPKASLFRILQTLRACGYVAKDEKNNSYRVLARLVPIKMRPQTFEGALIKVLDDLALRANFSTEWHIPTEEGMELSLRSERPGGEIIVRARVGQSLKWNQAELPSPLLVGLAFTGNDPFMEGRWIFGEDGEMIDLSKKDLDCIISGIVAKGIAVDSNYNLNGVRRISVPFFNGNVFKGSISIATTYRPKLGANLDILAPLLKSAILELSRYCNLLNEESAE
ncbi:MAG: hypothetical protein A2X49_06255 [Lentisphaerae bacterium GWF2_52_8]|nr:MAG: hypothetical protein A2X49_06255 [Lentisphaerae bacterium GWF2_52_8]